MTITLILPTLDLCPQYEQMLAELPDADSWNGYSIRRLVSAAPGFPYSGPEPAAFIDLLMSEYHGLNLPEGWVPQTTFWALCDGQLIGEARLRHSLTPLLMQVGGHIGFMVRPSQQGKGLGTLILQLLLCEAGKLHLERVLLICDPENAASRRVIEKNGGVLDDAIPAPDQDRCRYWIDL